MNPIDPLSSRPVDPFREIQPNSIQPLSEVGLVHQIKPIEPPQAALDISVFNPENPNLVNDLRRQDRQIELSIAAAEKLDPYDAKPVEFYLRQIIPNYDSEELSPRSPSPDDEVFQLVYSAMPTSEAELLGNLSHSIEGVYEPLHNVIEGVTGGFQTHVVSTLQSAVQPFEHLENLATLFANKVLAANMLIHTPLTFGKGATLIFKRSVLNKVWQQVFELDKKYKATKDPAVLKRMEELRVWLEVEEKSLQESSIDLGFEAVSLMPQLLEVGSHIAHVASPVIQLSGAGGALLVQSAVQGYNLVQSVGHAKEQREYIKQLQKTDAFEKIYAKRSALAKAAKNNPSLKERETINASVRAGVKTLALAKQENERKFFNFKVGSTAISFSLTTIIGVTLLALKIAAVAGVLAIGATALAYSGIGLVVLGVAVMAVGIAFLAYYKPQVFKTLFKGVQATLALTSIPKAIAKYKASRKELEQLKISSQVQSLTANFEKIKRSIEANKFLKIEDLPPELQALGKRFKHRLEIDVTDNASEIDRKLKLVRDELVVREKKIAAELEILEINAKKWSKRVNELHQKIGMAHLNDFVSHQKIPLTSEEVLNALVDSITNIRDDLESDTKKVLTLQFGLNLEKLTELNNQEFQDSVKLKILKHFSLSDKAMVKFIREQEAKIKRYDRGIEVA